MSGMESLEKVLALAVPQDPDLAMVLLMIRKIAAGELDDSQLANLGYQAFGREFERPLTLIRAYLIETASASTRQLRIVRQNHPKMTHDEGMMLDALALVRPDADAAQALLRQLCGSADVSAPLAAAHLLARALIDLGCPLGGTDRD